MSMKFESTVEVGIVITTIGFFLKKILTTMQYYGEVQYYFIYIRLLKSGFKLIMFAL